MKRSDIPALDDLRAFDAVARLGSIRAAAEDLSLTHSAISRRVTKLSSSLETPLIEPEGRGIRLTNQGKVLAKAAREAFLVLTDAVETIRQPSLTTSLLLSCEPSVAMRWLIPRLSEFQDKHPNVPVNLSVGGGDVSFERDQINMAIRRLDFPLHPAWQVTRLCPEKTGPVTSPAYLDRYLTGNFVGLASRTRIDAWEKWQKRHPNSPRPKEIRVYDHHFLMVEAAASGLGVAQSPKILAIDDIERNRLVAPEGFSSDGTWYGLIETATATVLPPSQVALFKWVCNAFSSLD